MSDERDDDKARHDPTDEDVEATLREVRAFLDDPIALLEPVLQLLSQGSRHDRVS